VAGGEQLVAAFSTIWRCTYPQCGTLHRALAWPCGWLARRTAVTVASYLASNPDLLLLHDTIAVLDNNKGLPEPSAKVSWLHALG